MKRLRLLSVLIFVSALFVLVPAAQGLPAAAGWVGSGSSKVVIQNKSTTAIANVVIEYIDQAGTTAYSAAEQIPSLGSTTLDVSTTPLSNGWLGSMILSSDQPLAAVTNIFWTGGGYGDGKSAGTYTSFSAGSTILYFPFLSQSMAQGQYATFTVQNADADSAHISIAYIDSNGNPSATPVEDDIPAGAQRTYDLSSPGGKVPTLSPNGVWRGAAIVTSTNSKQLAGVANVHWNNYSGSYSAFTSAGTTIYLPSIYRRIKPEGWYQNSKIQLQNFSDSTAHVTLYYYDNNGNQLLKLQDTIPPKAAHAYNTKAGETFPPSTFAVLGDWYNGPAKVTSDQPVVAVALTQWWQEVTAGIYESQTSGATELFVPDVVRKKSGATWFGNTALIVQNLGTQAATIELYFYDQDGTQRLYRTDTIPVSACHAYNTKAGEYLLNPQELGDNFTGSVYIRSTNGQPIIGIVNSKWWDFGEVGQFNMFQ